MDHSFSIHKSAPPGGAPGSIHIPPGALKPVIRTFTYSKEAFTETEHSGFSSVKEQLETYPDHTHWISIKGYGDLKLLLEIGSYFSIHSLLLEDVVNVYQRPKMEEFEKHVFLISRMIQKKENIFLLENEQLSIFLGTNYILTFQGKYEDFFGPVIDRLRYSKGFIRTFNADYLAYALMDAVIDNYFPLLESLGEKLDKLELELLMNPTRHSMRNLLRIKRQLISFRRVIWAERDKINDILRTSTPLISKNTKLYLRDTYDHTIQVMDLLENYKEITSSMMDIYLSSVSNRMNQIMKVLAIISTIFIPLTFIVGVYGMNFARTHPETGEKLSLNMPELYSPYGYAGVMLFMVLVVIIQLYVFYRRGWLGSR